MKKSVLYVAVIWMGIACSCGSDAKKGDQLAADSTKVEKSIRPQMQPSVASQTATLNSKEYSFSISRHPDAELPEVKLEDGSSYMDNSIDLKITQGGTEVYHHIFKKEDFRNVVPARFMEHAILEGLVFDRIENRRFLFAASVCYPMTDLYVPARVLVSPQGSMSIEKEDSMDDTLNDSITD